MSFCRRNERGSRAVGERWVSTRFALYIRQGGRSSVEHTAFNTGAFLKKENAVQVGAGRERFVSYGVDAVGDDGGGQPRALVEALLRTSNNSIGQKNGINGE